MCAGSTLDNFTANLTQPFEGVLASIAGVPPSWVDVRSIAVVSTSSAQTPRRRRDLLQATQQPLAIESFVASYDPDLAKERLQQSIVDGTLAAKLAELGLTLVTGSVVFDGEVSLTAG